MIAEEARKNLPAIQAAIAKHAPFFERIGRLQFGLLPGATGIHQDEVRRRFREWQICATAPRQLADGFQRLEDLKVRIHQSPEAWEKRHKEYCRVECFGMRHACVATKIESLRTEVRRSCRTSKNGRPINGNATASPRSKTVTAAPVAVDTRTARVSQVESDFIPDELMHLCQIETNSENSKKATRETRAGQFTNAHWVSRLRTRAGRQEILAPAARATRWPYQEAYKNEKGETVYSVPSVDFIQVCELGLAYCYGRPSQRVEIPAQGRDPYKSIFF